MTHWRYLIFSMLFVLTGCAEEPKKEEPLVQTVDSPTGTGSALPFLFSDSDNLLLSWVEPARDSLMVLKYSFWEEQQWGRPKEIIKASDWFVNWADFPAIAENEGNLLTHVLKKSSEGTYSYDIKLNLKKEGAEHWQTNLPLHADNTPTEHGFVTTLPFGKGFFVTWLDGRNTIEDSEGNRGAMTIRAAEVASDGSISNEMELDARTCDCCQTTAAITENGPVVIYRDRSEEEIRDINIVRKVAGEWTAPKAIHDDGWKIKGCPVNGPKATALGNHLAVAWFTAGNEKPMVNLVFSKDGGATFEAPIRIDEANAMGRVDILLLDAQNAIVSWMETNEGEALIKAVRVNRDGTKGEVRIIAQLDASRKTGFPQMELTGDKVHFAWTDVADEKTAVRTAFVLKEHF